MLQAELGAGRDVVRRFNVITFHIHDPDGDVHTLGDSGNEFDLRKFAAGHFHVQFVHLEIKKCREHGSDAARADGTGLVVSKTEVGPEAQTAGDWFDGAIEDIHKTGGILLPGITAHGRLIHTDFRAACGGERFQLRAHQRQQRFGKVPSRGVLIVREKPATQGVGPGHAGFEGGAGWCQQLQALELLHHSQPTGGIDGIGHGMFPALVMRRWTKAPWGSGFQLQAMEMTIKRQIEIEAGLLAIRDHIQSGGHLIMHRRDHGVILHFG